MSSIIEHWLDHLYPMIFNSSVRTFSLTQCFLARKCQLDKAVGACYYHLFFFFWVSHRDSNNILLEDIIICPFFFWQACIPCFQILLFEFPLWWLQTLLLCPLTRLSQDKNQMFYLFVMTLTFLLSNVYSFHCCTHLNCLLIEMCLCLGGFI